MNPWLIKARLQPLIIKLAIAGAVLFGAGIGVGMMGWEPAARLIGFPGLGCLAAAAIALPIYLIALGVSWGIDTYDSAAQKSRD